MQVECRVQCGRSVAVVCGRSVAVLTGMIDIDDPRYIKAGSPFSGKRQEGDKQRCPSKGQLRSVSLHELVWLCAHKREQRGPGRCKAKAMQALKIPNIFSRDEGLADCLDSKRE